MNKVQELINEIKVAMLVTQDEAEGLRSRPMHTVQVDEDGTIWFFTSEYSGKVEEINSDHPVNLAYAAPERQSYVSVTGFAYLVEDQQRINDLWNPIFRAWFPEGPQDESVSLIKVVPTVAEYWEGTSSKIKQLYYAGKAILTGEKYVEGEHGKVGF